MFYKKILFKHIYSTIYAVIGKPQKSSSTYGQAIKMGVGGEQEQEQENSPDYTIYT